MTSAGIAGAKNKDGGFETHRGEDRRIRGQEDRRARR
jgi:hypothetical protein